MLQIYDVSSLARWDAAHPGNAVRALFERWARPGCPLSPETPLRMMPFKDSIAIYHYGRKVGSLLSADAAPLLTVTADGGVRTYRPAALATPKRTDEIISSIEEACTTRYEGSCFLDEVIAANPGVIGVTAESGSGDRRYGGRIAVAQVGTNYPAGIALWDVMTACSHNLHGRDGGAPALLQPIENEDDGNAGAAQLRQAAETLVNLDELFRRGTCPRSASLWRALTTHPPPAIIGRPGLIVSAYWPKGYNPPVASRRIQQCVDKLSRTGVIDFLREGGRTVVMAQQATDATSPAKLTLPLLNQ